MSDNKPGKPTSFATPEYEVRDSGLTHCDACDRRVRATDYRVMPGELTVICGLGGDEGCHRTLSSVTWK
jgi:hypothetical protein